MSDQNTGATAPENGSEEEKKNQGQAPTLSKEEKKKLEAEKKAQAKKEKEEAAEKKRLEEEAAASQVQPTVEKASPSFVTIRAADKRMLELSIGELVFKGHEIQVPAELEGEARRILEQGGFYLKD